MDEQAQASQTSVVPRKRRYEPDPAVQQQNITFLDKFFSERNSKRYMIPIVFPAFNPTDVGKLAEEKMFNILKQIDEPMVVFTGYDFSTDKLGEIDFLVCHKNRGIMIFESKASKNYKAAYKDGCKQGQKNAKVVKKIMEYNLKLEKKDVRYAVVMPNVSNRNASRGEGVYMEDLESKEFFQAWLDEYRPTNGREFNDVQYDLCLTFFLDSVSLLKLHTSINYIHDQLVKLTPDQAKVLNGLPEEFYIAGPAGSGKTEIMIHKASEEDLFEQKKLIVVVNKALKEYLEWRMKKVPNLTIFTFMKLLFECTKEELRSYTITKIPTQQLVRYAIDFVSKSLGPGKFDSIFVDEGQNMEGDNWEILIDLLHNKGPNHFKLIFFDDNQKVNFANSLNPPTNQVFHLTEVIRNTRNIFIKSLPFCRPVRTCKVRHKYDGPEVTWNTNFTDRDLDQISRPILQFIYTQVDVIWKELNTVTPMDICILVENKKKADYLSSKFQQDPESNVCPFDVEEMTKHLDNGMWPDVSTTTPEKRCGVTVDSVSRYTGLESKVVILLIDHKNIYANVIEKVYTGITRCSCKLIVIISEEGDKVLDRMTTCTSIEQMEID